MIEKKHLYCFTGDKAFSFIWSMFLWFLLRNDYTFRLSRVEYTWILICHYNKIQNFSEPRGIEMVWDPLDEKSYEQGCFHFQTKILETCRVTWRFLGKNHWKVVDSVFLSKLLFDAFFFLSIKKFFFYSNFGFPTPLQIFKYFSSDIIGIDFL